MPPLPTPASHRPVPAPTASPRTPHSPCEAWLGRVGMLSPSQPCPEGGEGTGVAQVATNAACTHQSFCRRVGKNYLRVRDEHQVTWALMVPPTRAEMMEQVGLAGRTQGFFLCVSRRGLPRPLIPCSHRYPPKHPFPLMLQFPSGARSCKALTSVKSFGIFQERLPRTVSLLFPSRESPLARVRRGRSLASPRSAAGPAGWA